MKSKYLSFLLLFCLCSCSTHEGPKFIIDRVEQGSFISIDSDTLYEKVITNSEPTIVLFTVPNCASCLDAKEQIETYCVLESVEMYYIDFSTLDEKSYNSIRDITMYIDDVYALPEYGEDIYLPVLYFFLEQAVVYTIDNNFVDFFVKRIQIN